MLLSIPGFYTTKNCRSPSVDLAGATAPPALPSSVMYNSSASAAPICAASQISTLEALKFCTSISTTTAPPYTQTSAAIAAAAAAAAVTIPPPPPYSLATSMNNSLVPPPPYSVATCCHASVSSDVDVDVVGLTDEARGVRLSDDEEDMPKDEPLDLSVKKRDTNSGATSTCCSSSPSSSSTQPRPSVICNGYAGRHSDMRRSASSVTSRPAPEPDVSEHFRRSLSGKWPRRQTNHAHYTPLQSDNKEKTLNGAINGRKTALQSTLSWNNARRSPPSTGASPPQQIIVNNSGIEIEDHFRKALGAEAYEMLRKIRQTNRTQ